MPTLDEYMKSGGYAKDSQAQAAVNGGKSNFTGMNGTGSSSSSAPSSKTSSGMFGGTYQPAPSTPAPNPPLFQSNSYTPAAGAAVQAQNTARNEHNTKLATDPLYAYQDALAKQQAAYQAEIAKIQKENEAKALAEKQAREAQKLQMIGNMKTMYDASFANAKSGLDANKSNQLAELQKAYADAVTNGELTVREAEEAFNAQKSELDAAAYQASQQRGVLGAQRGIGNSQQLAGMQATDQANFDKLKNSATTARNTQVNEIRQRINALTTQKDLDLAKVNESYNAALSGARSQADLQYNAAVNNLNAGDYAADRAFSEQMAQLNSAQQAQMAQLNMQNVNAGAQAILQSKLNAQAQQAGFKNQVEMQQMAHGQALEILAKQAGYQSAQDAVRHGYDMEKLTSTQEFAKLMADITQGYTQSNMGLQYGYDIGKINQQGAIQGSLQSAAQKNAESLWDKQQAAKDNDYYKSLSREAVSLGLSPMANEYAVRQAQQKQASSVKKQDAIDKMTTEYDMKNVFGNPILPQALAEQNAGKLKNPVPSTIPGQIMLDIYDAFNPFYSLTDETSAYNSKLNAIDQFNKLYGK